MTELKWQSKIIRMLADKNVMAWKASPENAAGMPDLAVVARGIGTLYIEVKTIKGNVSGVPKDIRLQPCQSLFLSRLQQAGAFAFVCIVYESSGGKNYIGFIDICEVLDVHTIATDDIVANTVRHGEFVEFYRGMTGGYLLRFIQRFITIHDPTEKIA